MDLSWHTFDELFLRFVLFSLEVILGEFLCLFIRALFQFKVVVEVVPSFVKRLDLMSEDAVEHNALVHLLRLDLVLQLSQVPFYLGDLSSTAKVLHFLIVVIGDRFNLRLYLLVVVVKVPHRLDQLAQIVGQLLLLLGDLAEAVDGLLVLLVNADLVPADELHLLLEVLSRSLEDLTDLVVT